MNEQEIVQSMITFIGEKEKLLQIEKLSTGQAKTDIVKQILDELERVTTNENK